MAARSSRPAALKNAAGAYLLPRLRPGLDLLDVGCGPGTLTVDLARAVAPGRVVGVDAAAGVVGAARAVAAGAEQAEVTFEVADLFALPSSGVYETWGLAVNEAMHMGVPCLVSDRVGCQRDLVTDGDGDGTGTASGGGGVLLSTGVSAVTERIQSTNNKPQAPRQLFLDITHLPVKH